MHVPIVSKGLALVLALVISSFPRLAKIDLEKKQIKFFDEFSLTKI
jgi:hypothetical protein